VAKVLVALAVAVVALAAFIAVQAGGKHPMVPLDLFRSRVVVIASGTGFAFMSGFVSPLSARLAERFGPRVPIVGGMSLMGAALAVLAALPASAPVWLLAVLVIPVGICGPLAMQPTTAVLLESVPADRSGVASAVFNTSRQIGGALAVAVFGALVANRAHFLPGLRESLMIAAVVAFTAAAANLWPNRQPGRDGQPLLLATSASVR
jgi:sugar phosphate permease